MIAETHLDVFWIGQDGQIWSQWWDQAAGQNWGNHNPFPIASSFPVPARANSPIAAVARLPGQLDVFWIGQDGQIWSQWWDQAAGQSWGNHNPFPIASSFPVPAGADSPIAAVARLPGHLDVFWVGQDSQIWSQWWDQAAGQSWGNHNPFPIASRFPVPARADSPIAAVARLPGQLDVFWIGQDGQIWSQWWDQAAGQSWGNHNPFPIASSFPVPAGADSPIAAVARLPGHLDVFWVGQDSQIWSQWWDQAAGQSWGNHNPFPIASSFPVPARADSPIAAVARLPGHLDVFWVGQDSQIWSQWWDQAAGQSWGNHNPFPIASSFPVPARADSPIAAVARLTGQLDVFWIGQDDQIWSQWWDQAAGQSWGNHNPFPIASSFPVPARADSPIAAVGRTTPVPPPAGGWSSGTNAVLIDQCQALGDITVNLAVSEDLVTAGDSGFSLQLNCYPMPGVSVVGLPLNWIQFTLYVSNLYGNNTAAFQWQAWSLGATGFPQGQPLGTTQPQQPVPPFNQPFAVITSVPSNRLPKGSNLSINLETDPSSHGVTRATFTVGLAGAAAQSVPLDFPASIPFNFTTGSPGAPVDAQFPIGGFQVNLVGPGNLSNAAFTSGAGELTYSVPSASSLSVQNGGVGTGCGQYPGAITGETSNVVYDAVSPLDEVTLSQPFGHA